MNYTMIGVDTSKEVFHLNCVNEKGERKKKLSLKRDEFLGWFAKLDHKCLVVFEACGASHHWGRALTELGFEVKLVVPEACKPFVKKGKKNDAADASAVCEAARRPDIKFVPIKTVEQQDILALHTTHRMLTKQATMLSNAMRGLATEFGMVVPKGTEHLVELLRMAEEDDSLPDLAKESIAFLREQYDQAERSLAKVEKRIESHVKDHDMARNLSTIPGVGKMTASLVVATVPDIKVFEDARHFSAWLGLVPRQNSTGGKTKLGRITKAGNKHLRTALVLGATSMVRWAKNGQWSSEQGQWMRHLLDKKSARLASVALANKNARVIWALMTRNETYRPRTKVMAAAKAAA